MDNKKSGTLIGGVLLLAIAVWIFITGTDPTFKYLGGAIFGVLGLGVLINGILGMRKEA